MDIQAIITSAATQYGVDPSTAIRIAQIESSLNPRAQNSSSSAGGLFQFIDSTWAEYGNGRHKYDPVANADAGMRYTRTNINGLRSTLGRDPTPGEIYLAHQQGLGGARTILSNPDTNAVQLLGRDKVLLNGGNDTMTAGEFAQLWFNKMGDTSVPRASYSGGGQVFAPGVDPTYNPNASLDPSQGQLTFSEVRAASFASDSEKRAQERATAAENAANAPSLFEGAATAIQNNWSILAPMRAIGNFEPDMNFRITPEILKSRASDLPTEYLSELEGAVSEAHFEALAGRLRQQLEANRKLASMGGVGVGLQIAAALTDPGAIAATVGIAAITGGTGLAPAVAARFGRVGTVALAATEGAVGNLAVDAPLYAVDPTMTGADLMMSTGLGLVMGGSLAPLTHRNFLSAENRAMVVLGKQMQRDAGVISGRNSSAGAAHNLEAQPYRTDSPDLHTAYTQLGEGQDQAFGGGGFTISAQMNNSKNPMVSYLADELVENATRNKRGQVTRVAASERQYRINRAATAEWSSEFGGAWDAHIKANNVGFWKRPEALVKFNEDVMSFAREGNPSVRSQFSPEVQRAGAAFKKLMDHMWHLESEAGLTRTTNGIMNYVPRYVDRSMARKRVRSIGYSNDPKQGGLASFFGEAIRRAQPDIDEALAFRFGHAIIRRMDRLQAGEELNLMRGLGDGDLDDLRQLLNDTDLAADDIDEIVKTMTHQGAKDASDSGRMKHRIIFDENFEADVRALDGSMQRVKMGDFYLKDMNLVANLYTRQMSGRIALAGIKVYHPNTGDLLIDGIKNASDENRLYEQIIGVGNEVGAQSADDLKNVKFAINAILGRPNFGTGDTWTNALQLLRDFNFARLMGQVGLAQIPEFGRVTAQMGLKTTLAAMPSFRQLLNAARTGKLGDGLDDELMALGGYGTDYMRNRFHLKSDEFGVPITQMSGNQKLNTAMEGTSQVLHQVNRFVTLYSGMAPINGLLQRWASRAFAVKMVKMAKFGDGVNTNRMRALGLDEEMQKRVFAEIDKHARFKDGVMKPSKLEALGLDDWEPVARAAFEDALDRASRTIILENDVGQMAKWMQSPLGRTLLQFRSFTIGAWTKALLQGLNLRDTEAALGFLTSSFLGGLVYVGQTHANALLREDREEYLEKRLGLMEVAKAAFQRTSEASLLPMAVDTVSAHLLGEQVFDGRTTGLSTDIVTGNPTYDLGANVSQAFTGISTAILKGDDYSRPDFQSLVRSLPGQRLMGFTQFFNWMASGLPQREMREYD